MGGCQKRRNNNSEGKERDENRTKEEKKKKEPQWQTYRIIDEESEKTKWDGELHYFVGDAGYPGKGKATATIMSKRRAPSGLGRNMVKDQP